MTTIAPIDRVIRHVNKDAEPNGEAEKIVYLDTENREVLERIPFFGFLKDIRYCLVCNSSDPQSLAQSGVTGQTLQSVDLHLPLSMTYNVRCRPGNEGRAVLALYDPERSAGEVLDRLLMRWITAIGQDDIPAFVATYLEDRGSIEAAIAGRALAEAGLDIAVRLSLDWEKALATLNVNRDHLRVLTSDFQDEEQDVSVKVALEIDERRKRDAILRYREQPKL